MTVMTLAIDVLVFVILGVVLFAGLYGLYVGVVETKRYLTGEKNG